MSINLVVTIVIPLLLGVSLVIASWAYYIKENNTISTETRRYRTIYGDEEVKKIKRGKQVTTGFLVVAVGTAFFIPTLSLITSYMEQSPDVYNFAKWNNSNILLDFKYPNPLTIPVKHTIDALEKTLYVKINHSNNITIQSVELISPQNSPISATGNFNETANKMSVKEFKLPIKVFHFDDISNKTYNYSLYLSYVEGTNKSLQQVTVPFEWRIIMKDLPWLNYLWIVMAGVVASRFITFIADTNKNEPLDVDRTESLWIAFTFIIAVIAFASFKENVPLGGIVIFNILASFAFGFGSQKVLELARAFPGTSISFPEQVSGLAVSRPESNQVKLEWKANPETDIDHYNIYRGNAPRFIITVQAPTGMSATTSYTDTGLEPSQDYYYRVSAVNKAGNIGTHSSEIIARHPNDSDDDKPKANTDVDKPEG